MMGFKSKITNKVLGYYFLNPHKRHYINELATMLEVDAGNLKKSRQLFASKIFQTVKVRLNFKIFQWVIKKIKGLFMENFIENEKKILNFWQENRIFEKLREKNKGKKRWSFLDGPITANNPMGVHHAWGRTYKDVFQRYKAMQGFDQRFQNGFDCQGLWVEVEVEKELGFKNKKDIERYGIEKFVQKCKERVLKYSKIQTEQSIRLGQWMDWKNSYFTMSDENNYGIWYFLKKCWQQGLLYKGKDSVPWCPRCGTAISQHEILTEDYQEIVHKAIFFKLPVIGQENTYFLVWTTTPWTLPGNVALAVQPDFEYVKTQSADGNIYILLKEAAKLVEGGKVLETLPGKKLEGLEYKGIFDELPHKVILWKDITAEEGTGIVHIAPGCGQEDYQLSKELGLPVIDLTDENSVYRQGFGQLSGKFVGSNEVWEWISKNLESKGLVFRIEDYRHRYPLCWRCKTELIFRLVDEWYISMENLRESLIETAKKINWLPSFGLEREIDWLGHMRDWLISKKRYWGLALPIFECQKCHHFSVIGSKRELKEKTVEGWDDFEGHSPHRPWVDKIKIKCPQCGSLVSRIPDVGNPWLDAGIVPFSTLGYFRDKKLWEKWFPADFICESFPGQFKNWFYSLLVMSQVLENTEPFRTVFGYATVVDEKGEEMHKSKGNAIWFDEAVEKIGADVMRWLYVKQNPSYNLRFGYKVAAETKRKLLTLWNCFIFFETYREKSKSKEQRAKIQIKNQKVLDRWIISKLNRLIESVTNSLDKYDAAQASLAIENFFIEDLSLWYIRRSRKRFQNPETEQEKHEAEETLYYVLLNLVKLIAPMLPFLAEGIYQKLRAAGQPESLHLCDWPKVDKKVIDEELEDNMARVRQLVALALAKRAELGIKVRQPIASLKIKSQILNLKNNEELLRLLKEEVNVKEVVFGAQIKEEIELETTLTPGLKEEGYLREIIRHIQDLRKKTGLTPQDKVVIHYLAAPALVEILNKNKKVILETTRSKGLNENLSRKGRFVAEKEIKINNLSFWLAIEH